jgi:uncharacterized integral membrane protein (TIGR00698 family)
LVATTRILPGLALSFAIAALAYGIVAASGLSFLSPLIVAIVLGIVGRLMIRPPIAAEPGLQFALRPVLRFAIVLLGLQLTIGQVISVGGRGVLIILAGRLLGVDRKLTELIAAGTSICGASAILATNAVTRGSDEDVAYAVACVTLFGSLSMVLFPLIAAISGMGSDDFGLWTGAAIHEVAQVLAAAFQGGEQALESGTIAKLSRVMLLAPLVLSLGYWVAWRGRARLDLNSGKAAGPARVPMPWFVLGFLAMVALNSAIALPEAVSIAASAATSILLAAAMAAMGLMTDIGKLRAKGLRPLALGAVSWIFISVTAFVLIAV